MKFLHEKQIINILQKYFNNIIKISAKYTDSCLLLNGYDTINNQPAEWKLEDGTLAIMSSLSRQINLLKALKIFSYVINDKFYSDKYDDILKFYFSSYQNTDGLMYWGGHIFIDLKSMKPAGPINKMMCHEIKNTFPDYNSMFQINIKSTSKFIKALWMSHIMDKNSMIMSRHGNIRNSFGNFNFSDLAISSSNSLLSSYLTFLNSANDLIYAAFKYFKYNKDRSAIQAAEFLYNKYLSVRNKNTGLGSYLYTIPKKLETPKTDTDTKSWFGDRALRQLGPELGQRAVEMNLILKNQAETIYGETPLMLFNVFQEVGDDMPLQILKKTAESMEAFTRYIYIDEYNKCRPVLTDGTDLDGFILQREGYFGKKGTKLQNYNTSSKIFSAFLKGSVFFKDNKIIYDTAKNMFKKFNLGNLGSSIYDTPQLFNDTKCSDPQITAILIDLYLMTGKNDYLNLAGNLINNIIENFWHEPYFKHCNDAKYANFDTLEPYVISYFLAVCKKIKIEPFLSSSSFIYGNYLFPDGNISDFKDTELYKIVNQ